MSNERADFVPAWWRIGESLRDYFTVPAEFPFPLLTLVLEGDYLFRHSDVTADWPAPGFVDSRLS